MLNVGTPELLVILLVALLVLGPNKLPEAARQVGRAVAELRRLSSGFQAELRSAMDEPTVQRSPTPLAVPAPDPTDHEAMNAAIAAAREEAIAAAAAGAADAPPPTTSTPARTPRREPLAAAAPATTKKKTPTASRKAAPKKAAPAKANATRATKAAPAKKPVKKRA